MDFRLIDDTADKLTALNPTYKNEYDLFASRTKNHEKSTIHKTLELIKKFRSESIKKQKQTDRLFHRLNFNPIKNK